MQDNWINDLLFHALYFKFLIQKYTERTQSVGGKSTLVAQCQGHSIHNTPDGDYLIMIIHMCLDSC